MGATGFVHACYAGDYTKFSSRLARHLSVYAHDEAPEQSTDDLVATLVKLLNDRRCFLKMLFKSIERNRSENMKVTKEEVDSEDDEDEEEEEEEADTMTGATRTEKGTANGFMAKDAFEHILAVMIVKLSVMARVSGDGSEHTESSVSSVMRKCDELGIDERTKGMIHFFFGCWGKPELAGYQLTEVCTLPPMLKHGCIVM